MSTSRRKFLKTMGATAPALMLAKTGFAGRMNRGGGGGGGMGGGGSTSINVPVFELPLNIPPVAQPSTTDAQGRAIYELTQMNTSVEIIPGYQTNILGYNGMTPGPTIKVDSDEEIIVRQINNTNVRTTTHLHGGHMPAGNDGHPVDYVNPGTYKDYLYTNKQQPATLWYHDHTMDLTGDQVYAGLAGFYIIDDDYERSLGLPSGNNEVAIVIQDRTFSADGSLLYSDNIMGETGDTILVNGTPYPYFQVGTSRYRLRILNGSNARSYNLVLSNGASFTQIGSDGGLLEAPISRSSLNIAPAERLDVIIDFGNNAVGDQVILENTAGSGSTSQIMRFDIVRVEDDPSTVPSTLRSIAQLDPSAAVQTRRWVFGMGGGSMPWVINGQPYDENRVDAYPKLGTTEIWELVNRTGMMHPVHIHDIMWQVLDVNGRPPAPEDAGWKDTFKVPPMGTVRVIGRFDDYVGDPNEITSAYMMHCHILEHEDHAMMTQFIVVK